MKTVKYSLIILLSIVLFSCKDEPAAPEKTDIRAEISRTWSCVYNAGDGDFPFDATISKDPDSDNKIIIANFHNHGADAVVKAIVNDDRTIELTSQLITNTNATISGDGTINAEFTKIDLTYTYEDESDQLNVIATFTLGQITKKLL